jgi:hypothetical protein
MPEVADVLRRYGPDYRERFGEALLPSHRRAMEDIIHCRTEALGGQLLQCERCGQEHYVYHSCRNRSCPKCHHQDTEAWLEERRQELLPVPSCHVVLSPAPRAAGVGPPNPERSVRHLAARRRAIASQAGRGPA